MSHQVIALKLVFAYDYWVDGYLIHAELLFVFKWVLDLHDVGIDFFFSPYFALHEVFLLDNEWIDIAFMRYLPCINTLILSSVF